jgi:hypothetical protein
LNTGEATGDTMAKMLKEMEETSNLENPYCLASKDVKKHTAQFR